MTKFNQMTLQGKAATIALFLAVAIPAAVGVFGLLHAQSSITHNSWSLSIDEISKTVDMPSLPVQLVENAI